MLLKIKKIDKFTRNIIFVFAGSSLANFLNLIYQLLIAHKLAPQDFAVFNSLLAIYLLLSNPLGTLQLAVAKYSSDFAARGEPQRVKELISGLFRKSIWLSLITFVVFIFISFHIIDTLKIDSPFLGYILAVLLAFAWIAPVLSGALQGLELFPWLVGSSLISGIFKIAFTVFFIYLGFQIAGALGALLISVILGICISIAPLRGYLFYRGPEKGFNFGKIIAYLLPTAVSSACFIWLVSFDMVLVKIFFSNEASGIYSLAQMVGKIFLFLPGTISLVMFPRTSGLNAIKSDTKSVLRKSLFYGFCMCFSAVVFYNIFPEFVLRVLTGKAIPESVLLGRLFGVSMTLYALCFILINYYLSVYNLKFIKYLIASVVIQFCAIVFFHNSLTQIQAILCLNSLLLFICLMFGTRPQIHDEKY
jgi:O-antigen/teichoic acid export membrane protein